MLCNSDGFTHKNGPTQAIQFTEPAQGKSVPRNHGVQWRKRRFAGCSPWPMVNSDPNRNIAGQIQPGIIDRNCVSTNSGWWLSLPL